MPFRTAKVIGFPIENDTIGNKVEVVLSTADALVTRPQQVLMLIHHTEAKVAVHRDDKFW